MPQTTLLVLGDPSASHLKLLSRLPEETNITVTADTFKTAAGALLASGGYSGNIHIDITPGT